MELEQVTSKTEPIVCGPIVFDAWSGLLSGPTSTVVLQYNCRKLLLALMRDPAGLSEATLLKIGYPEGTRQPRRPDHALRMRIMRIRAALDCVGVGGHTLRNQHGIGYEMTLHGRGRLLVFSGARALELKALLASHPDRTAVACITGGSVRALGQSCPRERS